MRENTRNLVYLNGRRNKGRTELKTLSCCQCYQHAVIEGNFILNDSDLILRRARLEFMAQMRLQILN